jgi:hypothetical protein
MRDILQRFAPASAQWKMGDQIEHPKHGLVKIVSGQYLSNDRVSNHWSFIKVNRDGTNQTKLFFEYGWL